MASSKQIILITGGNSGIGFSLAELLLADESKHVIITSRDVERGTRALRDLQAMKLPGTVEMLPLEVADPDSILELSRKVDEAHGRLDALVNNAAQAVAAPGMSLFEHMQRCFAVNVSGPAVMIETFLPLLRKSSSTPRIINVGSGQGSIGRTLSPDGPSGPLTIPYKTSKAALNMLSSVEVVKLRQAHEKIKVFTYCPGFCVSNLGPFNKPENGAKPTVDGARPMVAILNGEEDHEDGGYLNSEGGRHPW
ncbi:uncharacterized protein PV07_07549 [Cladophialophora immunda]|uniref:NAD(P)-binding protein n=1 Tax=Cladophialophora immunda TaxID=569365 RepID=A0A0D2C9U2_9EURO|nr:uncharacterized protein PV07_07549 [Cladophialophora immunda]KIW27848.1 hypothetical protein PV07_07549 [Cladophialophora immunda]